MSLDAAIKIPIPYWGGAHVVMSTGYYMQLMDHWTLHQKLMMYCMVTNNTMEILKNRFIMFIFYYFFAACYIFWIVIHHWLCMLQISSLSLSHVFYPCLCLEYFICLYWENDGFLHLISEYGVYHLTYFLFYWGKVGL